jgi:hypothetical protein
MLHFLRDLAWALVVATLVALVAAAAGADPVRILESFLFVFAAAAIALTYLERRSGNVNLLDFEFHGDTAPYVSEFKLRFDGEAGLLLDRTFRVGIRNLTTSTVQGVHVVVESWAPPGDMVNTGYALGSTDSRNEFFDVYPLDRPTAFVDVLRMHLMLDSLEMTGPSNPIEVRYLGVCYANNPGLRTGETLPVGDYVVTLRLEGGNTTRRKSFKVTRTSSDVTFSEIAGTPNTAS